MANDFNSPSRKYFSEGQMVFAEGAPPGDVFVIIKGQVEISRKVNGEKKTLAIMGEKEIFGEMALIDNKPRSATATAITGLECYVVSKLHFEHQLKELSPWMRGIIRVLVASIRRLTEQQLQGKSQ